MLLIFLAIFKVFAFSLLMKGLYQYRLSAWSVTRSAGVRFPSEAILTFLRDIEKYKKEIGV
jgi:hypothetical protein